VKVVGLSIAQGRLSATVVQRQFGRTELLDAFSLSVGSDGELADALREKAKSWTHARIVLTIPGRLFSQRVLTLPFADRKRIEKALPFELEDLVPFELDDMVIDHLVLDGSGQKKDAETTVLCLVLPKTVLREHLDRLTAAGIDPHAVVPSTAALAAVARTMSGDAGALVISGGDACLVSRGTVKAVSSVARLTTGGLRHVVQALETGQKERVEKAMLLTDDADTRSALDALGVPVEQLTPELAGKKASDAVSLGAALTADLNFRKGEFAYRLADEGSRRRRWTLGIAAAAAAVLFCVNIGVKYSLVQSSYGSRDRDIKEIYRRTFPDARPPGDPVRDMRDRLADAKKRYGALGSGTSALDVMKTVTDGIPKEVRANFQEFTLEGDRLRLQGETPSFEAVDRIKAELQKSPLFADVSVQDTRMGVDNKVKFRLDIKLKQAM
jgi:general secretion pathway protein L